MQATSNLWDTLCKDLETSRRNARREEYVRVAADFVNAAAHMLAHSSPRQADAREIAGDICMEAGALAEAADHYRRAYDSAISISNQEQSGRIAAKLAQVFEELGEIQEAISQCKLALRHYEEAGDHTNHPTLLNQLASLFRRSGNLQEACQTYRRAIDAASQLHGSKHQSLAILYNNLGVALTEAGEYTQAENAHLQALSLRESNFGVSHPETAHSLANLGVLHHSRGDRQKAIRHFEAALEIYRKYYTPSSREIQTLQNWLNYLGSGTA